MDFILKGILIGKPTLINAVFFNNSPSINVISSQIRNYAARKGTRMKADKKKIKVEVKKLGFIPHNLRVKKSQKNIFQSKRILEEWKQVSNDDVWIAKYYRWRLFNFKEAVECHRETHDPTVFNQPNAKLQVFMELDMSTIKANKYVEKFTRTAMIPHGFDHGEDRSILVFCKSEAEKEAAANAGATLVGGNEIIKDIEKGRLMLPDFNVVLAHPDIFQDMLGIRGLLKKRFPNPKLGTVGPNMKELVTKFKNGITYSALRDQKELEYGWIDVYIGTLNMNIDYLEDNFKELVNDVLTQAPEKTHKPFITRVLLKSPPSVEGFKLDMTPYFPKNELQSDLESDEEEEVDNTTRIKIKM